MKKLFLVLLLLFCSLAHAQWTTVTASHIYGGTSDLGLLPAGTISFQATDNNGQFIAYQVGGTGQQINWPLVCAITNGTIAAACNVADTTQTNPMDICYFITVKNSQGTIVLGGSPTSGYQCAQPSGTTWNFDSFVPNVPGWPLAVFRIATTASNGIVRAPNCLSLGAGYFPQSVNGDGSWNCTQVSVTAGVNTFNGRAANVVPQAGDYTPAMVGLGNVQNVDQTNASNLLSGTVDAARLPNIPIAKLPGTGDAAKVVTSTSLTNGPIGTAVCEDGSGNLTDIGCPASSFTAGNDLSGTNVSQTVVGINGVPLQTADTVSNGTFWAYSSSDLKFRLKTIAQLLGYTAENAANKGAASGYAGLDGSSLVPVANIPSLAESKITNLVGDLSARLITTNNLSDLTSASSARTHLGLGAAAVLGTTGSAIKVVTSSGLSSGAGTEVCEDGSGNLKDTGCPSVGFTAGNDLSGTSTNQTVVGFNGNPLNTGDTVSDGAIWGWSTSSSKYRLQTIPTILGYTPVPPTRTINGHALSSDVTVSASDLTTGTLPHAQLPTLLSADIPDNAANTSGNALTASGTFLTPGQCSSGYAHGINSDFTPVCDPPSSDSDSIYTIQSGLSGNPPAGKAALYVDTSTGLACSKSDGSSCLPVFLAGIQLKNNGTSYGSPMTGNASLNAVGATFSGTAPNFTITVPYPGVGVANSTGSAWGTSYTVGSAANNLPQLDSGGKLLAGELPNPSSSTLGGVKSKDCSSQFLQKINTDGSVTCATPSGGAGGTAYGTDTSVTANVYTIPTFSVGTCPASHSAIPLGMQVAFVPHANNSSATPTLDICGFGSPNTIRVYGDAGLATGIAGVGADLNTLAQALVMWDGTYWQLLNAETMQGPTVIHTAAITLNHLQKVTSALIPSIGDTALTEASGVFATNADSFDNSGSTTQLLIAKTSTAVASADAGLIFDTTKRDYHAFINGNDARIATFLTSLTPTASQCAIWVAQGSAWSLGSAVCGGMTWPSGGAGIPNYDGASGWGTSYSASNTIPANFIPTLNQNTTGTAANLSGTPALPNGTSATTQTTSDTSTDIATDAFVHNVAASLTPKIRQLGGGPNGGTAAKCQSGLPGGAFSWFTSGTPIAACESDNLQAYLNFTANTTQTINDRLELPSDWTGTLNVVMSGYSTSTSALQTSTFEYVCISTGATASPSYANPNTVALTPAAASGRTLVTVAVTPTGCSAGNLLEWEMIIKAAAAADFHLLSFAVTE